VEEIVYDVLNRWGVSKAEMIEALGEKYSAAELSEAFDEIETLIAQEQLMTKPVETVPAISKGVVKAMCLHVAHDCNLRCGYCFADSGAYHGQRSLMSLETGKKALDFLIKASKHRKHIEVDFFGGEPLLNFDVCRELVKYGKEQGAIHNKIF
jgi:uncharacterized protein